MGRARLTTSIGWTKAAGQPSTTSLALVYLRPPRWPIWLVGVVAAFGAVEAATRRDAQLSLRCDHRAGHPQRRHPALSILAACAGAGVGRARDLDDLRQPARGLWRVVRVAR